MGHRHVPSLVAHAIAPLRAAAMVAIAIALLMPGAATASIFCSMAKGQVVEVCPCGHAEGEPTVAHSEDGTTIERAGCCSIETNAVSSSVKSSAAVDQSVPYTPTLTGQRFRLSTLHVEVATSTNDTTAGRNVRPPPTGPPLYIQFESLLN